MFARRYPLYIYAVIPFHITEEGEFLALDLGGTNFRVLLVRLKNDNEVKMESETYLIDQELMVGKGENVNIINTNL